MTSSHPWAFSDLTPHKWPPFGRNETMTPRLSPLVRVISSASHSLKAGANSRDSLAGSAGVECRDDWNQRVFDRSCAEKALALHAFPTVRPTGTVEVNP